MNQITQSQRNEMSRLDDGTPTQQKRHLRRLTRKQKGRTAHPRLDISSESNSDIEIIAKVTPSEADDDLDEIK